jgi:chitinase
VTPAIDPPAGTYSSGLTLTLSTATTAPGTTIQYTTDGSDPLSGTVYSAPFLITAPGTTVKAIALNPLMTNSPILTALYTINTLQVAPPVFTPPIGTYTSSVAVSMTTATSGAVIRYTTDGSTPTSSYGIIGSSVTVSDTMTLQAIAYDPLTVLTDSSITGGTYIIAPRITAITPNKGPNTGPVTVTVKGKNFKNGIVAKLTLAGYPDIAASSLTVVDSSTITCSFNITGAFQTKWDLVVTNTDGGSSTNVKYFRIY